MKYVGDNSLKKTLNLIKDNYGDVENKSSATIRSEITKSNVTDALGYTPYTPTEIDNKFSMLETNIDWKEAVNTYDDLSMVYPSPEDGWTVNIKDTDYTYRYNGTDWIAISANAIPKVTENVDGLLSKEKYIEFENANSKKHEHTNKTVLDEITSSKISNWNTVTNKVDKEEGKGLSSNDYTDEEKAQVATNKNDITSLKTDVEENKIDILSLQEDLQNIEIANDGIVTTTSTTLDNSKAGGYNLVKMVANTEQKQLTGKNLLPSVSNEITMGGITYKPIIKNGLLDCYSISGTKSADTSICILHEGLFPNGVISGNTYKVSMHGNNNYVCLQFIEIINGEYIRTLDIYGDMEVDWTPNVNSTHIIIRLEVVGGENLSNVYAYPMISKDGREYEPYCGGMPSPNPRYSQPLLSTGDCVDMIQGTFKDATGLPYPENKTWLATKNPIPCEIGDEICITLEKPNGMYIYYYDDNNKFINYGALTATDDTKTKYKWTVSSSTPPAKFNFTLGSNSGPVLTPDTIGKITITINGKYLGCVKTIPKNLINNALETNTKNGVTCTKNGDGTYTLNGTATSSTDFIVDTISIPNGAYKLVGCPSGGGINSYLVYIKGTNAGRTYDEGNGIIVQYDNSSYGHEVSIFVSVGAKLNNVVFKPMLTTDLSATYDDFVLYDGEPTIAWYTTQYPMIKGSTLFRENGLFKVEHTYKKLAFDGTETGWQWYSAAGGLAFYRPGDAKSYAKTLCNIYVTYLYDGYKYGVGVDGSKDICVKDDDHFTDLDTFKTYISTHPLEVEYELATPIIETLDNESQIALNGLETFDGVTYVEFDSRVQPLEVTSQYGATETAAIALKALNQGGNASGDYLPLTGGTMDDNAGITFNTDSSYSNKKVSIDGTGLKYIAPTSGGWSSGLQFKDKSNNSILGAYGAYGNGDELKHYFIGGTYNNPLVKVEPDGRTTVNGALIVNANSAINGNSGDTALTVKAAASSGSGSYIGFRNASKMIGYIGVNGNEQPSFYDGANSVGSTILHSNNYTTYCTPANIGAAASSHNHSATNITSGTLSSDRLPTVPISKGGTGATSVSGAVTNLMPTAFSTPAYVFTMGSSGYSGGGGYTTMAQLKTALGLGTAAYTASTAYATASHGHSAATTSANGLMTAAMVTKLNGIATGANNFSTGYVGTKHPNCYYKFSDGTLICVKNVQTTVAISTAWASGWYESPKISLGNWPFSFKSNPWVCAIVEDGGWAILESIQGATTTSAGYTYLARPSTTASKTYYIDIIAIGRWA